MLAELSARLFRILAVSRLRVLLPVPGTVRECEGRVTGFVGVVGWKNWSISGPENLVYPASISFTAVFFSSTGAEISIDCMR